MTAKLIEQQLRLHQLENIKTDGKHPTGRWQCSMIACDWLGLTSTCGKEFRKHVAAVIDDALTNPNKCQKSGYHASPHFNCRTFNDGVM